MEGDFLFKDITDRGLARGNTRREQVVAKEARTKKHEG